MGRKIIIDVVCPTGGFRGGIEDVIRAWVNNIDREKFELRIMHMTPGTGYLGGYEKVFFLNEKKKIVDANYCASGYNLFVNQMGAPDVCVATNAPFVSRACEAVRSYNKMNYKIFSWVHSSINEYEMAGNGGVWDMLFADYHFSINSNITKDIMMYDKNAIVYQIGNPILHEIPEPSKNINQRKLAFVGRLDMEKRIDLILEAIYKAKDKWYLDIVGDGELREEVNSWISLLKLDNQVKMLGWQEQPMRAIEDAVALVMASDYEGFGIVAAEALACGKSVISTPVQGVIDYVKEGKNGYFYDFDNAEALAGTLNDIADKKKKIASAKECIKSVEKFRLERYIENIEKILLYTSAKID